MTVDEAIQKKDEFIRYALNEDIPVSRWARLLVKQYLADIKEAEENPDFPYYFDEEAAIHNYKIFSNLQFSEGNWRGKPFDFHPWQAFTNWCVYGWKVKSNGWRRYFKVYIKVPRKNGKTEYLSAIGIYGHRFDPYEKDAQVFWFATKKAQANIGFKKQKTMTSLLCKKSQKYSLKVRVLQHAISDRDGSGFVTYLGKDSKAEDGHNPFYGMCDEYHAHPNNEMMDVIESGFGARQSPLMWVITTAGTNPVGPCAKFETTCQQILNGIIPNPGIFPLMFDIDEDEDWTSIDAWRRANPSLGVSISLDYLNREYNKALAEGSTAVSNFQTKNLNIWLRAHKTWIPDDVWMRASVSFEESELNGKLCFGGLDLATRSDLASYVLIFPPEDEDGTPHVITRVFCPEETAVKRTRLDGVPYLQWAEEGFLTLTPGNVTDYNYIQKAILQDCATFDVHSIAYDPYNSSQLVIDLQDEGVMMEQFSQRMSVISAPTKELERLAMQEKINHGGNPILRWAVSNVSIKTDQDENIKIDKGKSKDKVDSAVALVMALGQWAQKYGEIQSYGKSIFTLL